jgi:hypothetical protein
MSSGRAGGAAKLRGRGGWRSQQNRHGDPNQPLVLAHPPNGGHWPEYAFPGIGSPDTPVVQRSDGMWSIGWHDDAPGPFESREFAEAVARGEGRHALAT